MVVYWPIGQYVHDTPRWDISGGFLDTSDGRCDVGIVTADNYGYFNYKELAVYINILYADGTTEYTKVFGSTGYNAKSGTIYVDTTDARQAWLSVYCSKNNDGGGPCGSDWDLAGPGAGVSAIDTVPGWEIPNTRAVLTSPPSISSLTNTNRYNNQSGVSASTTSISLSWTQTAGSAATYAQYSLDGGGSWHNFGSSPYTSGTISGLTPGTSYAVDVRNGNSAGNSNSLYMAIRTRHSAPVVSITEITAELEALNVSWSSDKNMASVQYQLNGTSGSWITTGNTGRSGTFRIPNLNYNTEYTVYLRGTSTSTYDSLQSNTVNSSERTLDISHITNISSIIFGMSFTVTIDAESDNDMSLRIWTEGNERVAEITYIPTERSNVITFTQDQLDEIYKTYPRANTVEVHFVLSTIGENAVYDDEQEDTVITLTGIARTAHIGIGGIPKRADVFIGTLTGTKRCVVWIGDEDGTPRRCI